MIRVVLLGLGNVGIHLAKAFIASDKIELLQIYSRNKKDANIFDASIPITNNVENLFVADIYVLAISDDAISEFSGLLKFRHGLVVHTSGTVPLEALKCDANKGVFYPFRVMLY